MEISGGDLKKQKSTAGIRGGGSFLCLMGGLFVCLLIGWLVGSLVRLFFSCFVWLCFVPVLFDEI